MSYIKNSNIHYYMTPKRLFSSPSIKLSLLQHITYLMLKLLIMPLKVQDLKVR